MRSRSVPTVREKKTTSVDQRRENLTTGAAPHTEPCGGRAEISDPNRVAHILDSGSAAFFLPKNHTRTFNILRVVRHGAPGPARRRGRSRRRHRPPSPLLRPGRHAEEPSVPVRALAGASVLPRRCFSLGGTPRCPWSQRHMSPEPPFSLTTSATGRHAKMQVSIRDPSRSPLACVELTGGGHRRVQRGACRPPPTSAERRSPCARWRGRH
jgi:hypothetical protein